MFPSSSFSVWVNRFFSSFKCIHNKQTILQSEEYNLKRYFIVDIQCQNPLKTVCIYKQEAFRESKKRKKLFWYDWHLMTFLNPISDMKTVCYNRQNRNSLCTISKASTFHVYMYFNLKDFSENISALYRRTQYIPT